MKEDDGFTFITDKRFRKDMLVPIGHFICNKCKKRVEQGIVNISTHWAECAGFEFTQALMTRAKHRRGKITETDIEDLQRQFLK